MTSQMLLVEFHCEFEISFPKIWLMLITVVAVVVESGQLVLERTMMRIGSSQVTSIGIEPPNLTSSATSYS